MEMSPASVACASIGPNPQIPATLSKDFRAALALYVLVLAGLGGRMARLSLHLLGTLQVTLGGTPVTDFESDKERALLAFLAEES